MTTTEPTEAGVAPAKPLRLADGAELTALLQNHDRVLVEFYTANCGICASMEPVLGLVARESDAVVAMVNPGNDMRLTEQFAIRSVPTLILFRDGEEVARLADGFQGVEAVLDFIDEQSE